MIEKLHEYANQMLEIVDWIDQADNIKTEGRKKIVLVGLWNEYFSRLRKEEPTQYGKMIATAYKSMITKSLVDALEWAECHKITKKLLTQISTVKEEEWF